jgi:hypothetical protein
MMMDRLLKTPNSKLFFLDLWQDEEGPHGWAAESFTSCRTHGHSNMRRIDRVSHAMCEYFALPAVKVGTVEAYWALHANG